MDQRVSLKCLGNCLQIHNEFVELHANLRKPYHSKPEALCPLISGKPNKTGHCICARVRYKSCFKDGMPSPPSKELKRKSPHSYHLLLTSSSCLPAWSGMGTESRTFLGFCSCWHTSQEEALAGWLPWASATIVCSLAGHGEEA